MSDDLSALPVGLSKNQFVLRRFGLIRLEFELIAELFKRAELLIAAKYYAFMF